MTARAAGVRLVVLLAVLPTVTALGPSASAAGAHTTLMTVDSQERHVPGEVRWRPSISDDGQVIAFSSRAALVPTDRNGRQDVYVRDRRTGRTVRVSAVPEGVRADDDSDIPSISGNGRLVLFQSAAALVPGAPAGTHLFVRDLQAATTRLVDVRPDGSSPDFTPADGTAISAQGRFVAFSDQGSVYMRDLVAGSTRTVVLNSASVRAYVQGISADGRVVAMSTGAGELVPGDRNLTVDLVVRELASGTTSRVSVSSSGQQAERGATTARHMSLSADGRRIVFSSDSAVLAGASGTPRHFRVLVHDRDTGSTKVVSEGPSSSPVISADGRIVAFDRSLAGPVDSRLCVEDLATGREELVSRTSSNIPVRATNISPTLSADGRYVGFLSDGSFDERDGDPGDDVYLRDRGA